MRSTALCQVCPKCHKTGDELNTTFWRHADGKVFCNACGLRVIRTPNRAITAAAKTARDAENAATRYTALATTAAKKSAAANPAKTKAAATRAGIAAAVAAGRAAAAATAAEKAVTAADNAAAFAVNAVSKAGPEYVGKLTDKQKGVVHTSSLCDMS
jgi:hypothetical protein